MKPLVIVMLVLLVGVVGISLDFYESVVTGQYITDYRSFYSVPGSLEPTFLVQRFGSRTLSSRPMYLGAYHRCIKEAELDVDRCKDKYKWEERMCEFRGWLRCRARLNYNNCIMMAQATEKNCERIKAKVLHDLGQYQLALSEES